MGAAGYSGVEGSKRWFWRNARSWYRKILTLERSGRMSKKNDDTDEENHMLMKADVPSKTIGRYTSFPCAWEYRNATISASVFLQKVGISPELLSQQSRMYTASVTPNPHHRRKEEEKHRRFRSRAKSRQSHLAAEWVSPLRKNRQFKIRGRNGSQKQHMSDGQEQSP
jgi:hypothetical protein